jgi:hypothetical protein
MRRLLSIAVAVLFMAGAAGTALAAPSKCDASLAKAKGKKAACECGAVAKGIKKNLPPDFSKCVTKFGNACTKAQSAADCSVQTKSCAANETEVDMFVTAHCVGSPSGAFLE